MFVEPIPVTTLKCRTCKITKSLDDFAKSARCKLGRAKDCKPCDKRIKLEKKTIKDENITPLVHEETNLELLSEEQNIEQYPNESNNIANIISTTTLILNKNITNISDTQIIILTDTIALLQENYNGKPLQIFGTYENPLFLFENVSDILELSNKRRSLDGLDVDDISYEVIIRNGVKTRLAMVTETGLYLLVFKSRTDAAMKFKRWIAKELIPSIRKRGQYSLTSNIEDINQLKKQLESNEKKIKSLEDKAAKYKSKFVKKDIIYIVIVDNLIYEEFNEPAYKLGKTTNEKNRMTNYSTGRINNITPEYARDCSNIDIVEAQLKGLLRRYSHPNRSELFVIPLKSLIQIVECVINLNEKIYEFFDNDEFYNTKLISSFNIENLDLD